MSNQVKQRKSYEDIWEDLQALKMDLLCSHQDYRQADKVSKLQEQIEKANGNPNDKLDKLITSFHISLYKK